MKQVLALIAIFGLLAAPAAATTVIEPSSYSVQKLELTEAAVTSIVFSSDTAWIGSRLGLYSSGIAKPDIQNFYNKENGGLPDDYVGSLAVAPNGDLWIGTDSGLAKFVAGKAPAVIPAGSPFNLCDMGGLTVDKDGVLWAGGLSMDPEGDWFVGMGLVRYDGNTWQQFLPSNSNLKEDVIEHLAVDSSGRVWIGSGSKPYYRDWESGLSSFDGNTFTLHGSGESFINVNCLAVDAEDRVWVGFSEPTEDVELGSGLACIEAGKMTFYTTRKSAIPGDLVTDICVDMDGNLWMVVSETSYGHRLQLGLANFNGRNWKLLPIQDFTDEYEYADTIAIDPEGKLWVGTYDGVYVISFP